MGWRKWAVCFCGGGEVMGSLWMKEYIDRIEAAFTGARKISVFLSYYTVSGDSKNTASKKCENRGGSQMLNDDLLQVRSLVSRSPSRNISLANICPCKAVQ